MTDIQRPNYFTAQFLLEKDFNDEQAYHRDMRLRHNRLLHEWGVVTGLEVTKAGDKRIAVSEGMAMDKDGREIIVLPNSPVPKTINLDGLPLNTTIEITIIYHEIKDKPYRLGNETKYTRTTERPKFIIYGAKKKEHCDDDQVEVRTGSAPTNDNVIILARVTLDNNGFIDQVDNSVRKLASAKLSALDKLEVNGTVKATRFEGDGSGLTGISAGGTKWSDGGSNRIYYNAGNVGIGTNNPSEKLEVDGAVKATSLTIEDNLTVNGNIKTTGMIRGSSMPPNLIRNSYMNILDGNKPAGYTTLGNVTLEAAHPFTKGFEGPYVGEKPANAADSVDDATEENPYWFGRVNKGARIKRGGLADGWAGFTDGKILKITGDNSGQHTMILFPFESRGNFLTKKYVHLKAWLKISSGKQVGFGEIAGWSNRKPNSGLIITKEQSDNAPDGWYRVDGIISTSEVTKLGGQSFSMGIVGDDADGSFEVYLALPYLANLDNDSWLPSVSDLLSRDGLTVHPTSGNVGIGTTDPSQKLEVDGIVKATRFVGDGSGLTGIRAGGSTKWSDGRSNRIYYNAGNVGIGTNNPSQKLEVAGTVKATRFEGDGSALGSLTVDGNVGIGTTSIHNPQGWNQVLDILGSQHARLNVRSGGGVVTSVFSHDDWNGARGVIGTESNHPLTFATNYQHRMTIDPNGNVGIGTANPTQALDMGGRKKNLKFDYGHIGETGSGAATIIANKARVSESENNRVDYSHSNPDGVSAIELFYNNGISFFTKPTDSDTPTVEGEQFFSSGDRTYERMRISSSGNVGIGTTNPRVKLEVSGDIQATGKLSSQDGKVRRDFVTWSTTVRTSNPIHIKTNIPKKSNVMYRILVEGYNYGVSAAINSDIVGYSYQEWENIGQAQANDYANGVSISQYYSSDGYVVVKLTTTDTYFIGFSASAWFTNPNGIGFDISATVHHQAEDL